MVAKMNGRALKKQKKLFDSGELLSYADAVCMPAKCEPLGIKSNIPVKVTNAAHTTVGSMCWCILVHNT